MASTKPTVLVTGGNNGIGLATCELLASKGDFHVLLGSRSSAKGSEALSSIQSKYPNSTISLIELDITSDASIAAAVNHITTTYGSLSGLVNNAGICPTTFSRTILRDTLETNVTSHAAVTQAFLPLLSKSSSVPHIIYVSSVLGSTTVRSDPSNLAYGEDYKAYRISKAALNMLVACNAWEHPDWKVFAYCPGYVITDLAGMREAKIKQGFAKGPEGSARGIDAILTGKRDEESGKFLFGEAVGQLYPW
ncbi:short chain dehydrogenase [Periconia macrospinosa]|uniref:Short chain dehydrogenase n=1 Tax=Periconia macrospinosa TaxID=97972 RepID=A0A2V1DNV8_9PLEO|nr:short chain dehydrogenase [Periconia macrospinosa]